MAEAKRKEVEAELKMLSTRIPELRDAYSAALDRQAILLRELHSLIVEEFTCTEKSER